MSIRILWILLLVMLCQQKITAQSYSSTTASTGAAIIEPVGTENSGEGIVAYFYPGPETKTLEVNKNGIRINGRNGIAAAGQSIAPVLHVTSSMQSYYITYSFDPYMNNLGNSRDSIKIQSIHVNPVCDSNQGTSIPDLFSVEATLLLAPNQAPGQYRAGKPYTITVHFN